MSVSGEGTVGKFVLRTFNGIICVSTVLCGVDVKKWVALILLGAEEPLYTLRYPRHLLVG